MDKLEDKLRRLSKIEPSKGFVKASKQRLMHQWEMSKNETWFQAFLRKLLPATPSASFLRQAKSRILHQIQQAPKPIALPLYGLARGLLILKRVVASTLVMVLAVTSTLFFVEGDRAVEASEKSYLEVTGGNVEVKHADLLTWEDISGQMEVQAGDLFKVGPESEAIIRFFDDTELRLAENTVFVISQLAVSPGYARQGIIEIAVHEGSVWGQTLNVEDGYAGLTISTRDALLKTLNGSFGISVEADRTVVLALKGKADLSSLSPDTRAIFETLSLSAEAKALVYSQNERSSKPVILLSELAEQDLASTWVQENIDEDLAHLQALRDSGIARLTQVAGTLPGQMLYPIKQAKERLKLALGDDEDLSVKIEIANRRLSEAIVLLESGDTQKGRETLLVYQAMAREIAELNGQHNVAGKLLAPHQKVLVAELPVGSSASLVKDTLQETAEILAENPTEKARVRLASALERLQDVASLIESGDLNAATERMTAYQLSQGNLAEDFEDEEVMEALILEALKLKEEELRLFTQIAVLMEEEGSEEPLLAMIQSAKEEAELQFSEVQTLATPYMPPPPPEPTWEELRIAEIIEKIFIYSTWQGQQNQIDRLLGADFKNPDSLNFLIAIRNELSGRAADYLNVKILQLQKIAAYERGREIEARIQEARR
ncbi:MAG: DUF5667 domain-containing protein [Candidatus Peregrinibacteria bacterium]|nr:DUF5667 domain-containing protein [Candidatus Peregrinibacteria bacterium]